MAGTILITVCSAIKHAVDTMTKRINVNDILVIPMVQTDETIFHKI